MRTREPDVHAAIRTGLALVLLLAGCGRRPGRARARTARQRARGDAWSPRWATRSPPAPRVGPGRRRAPALRRLGLRRASTSTGPSGACAVCASATAASSGSARTRSPGGWTLRARGEGPDRPGRDQRHRAGQGHRRRGAQPAGPWSAADAPSACGWRWSRCCPGRTATRGADPLVRALNRPDRRHRPRHGRARVPLVPTGSRTRARRAGCGRAHARRRPPVGRGIQAPGRRRARYRPAASSSRARTPSRSSARSACR